MQTFARMSSALLLECNKDNGELLTEILVYNKQRN